WPRDWSSDVCSSDLVPPARDRHLVQAQLASVEEPEQFDVLEARLAERLELPGAVFLHVPRVAGPLAVGCESEHIWRAHVGGAARSEERRVGKEWWSR